MKQLIMQRKLTSIFNDQVENRTNLAFFEAVRFELRVGQGIIRGYRIYNLNLTFKVIKRSLKVFE